jgi:O-methyltransferase
MGDPAGLYLDLMKKTLSYALWPEPAVPLESFGHRRSRPRQALIQLVAGAARRMGLELHRPAQAPDPAERDEGTIRPMLAHTMIGRARLNNLQLCVERIIADGVPGDLIETGVWRGGAAIFMRAILAAHGVTDRRVFVADSFAGLPAPDAARYPADAGDQHHRNDYLRVSRSEVEENFRRYGLLDEQVVFLEGWFADTLSRAPVARLAVLRLDGDMYQSTIEALEALYPRLGPGGFCIVDDYALPGCRRAVDDYRQRLGIAEPLERIDYTGVFWRRGAG